MSSIAHIINNTILKELDNDKIFVNILIGQRIQDGNFFKPNNVKDNFLVGDDPLIGWLVKENKSIAVYLNPDLMYDDLNVYADDISVMQFNYSPKDLFNDVFGEEKWK